MKAIWPNNLLQPTFTPHAILHQKAFLNEYFQVVTVVVLSGRGKGG
ncbi:MAG: hypothetical protein GY801_31510 [bacterium]|nr:hypothetical protein [bacterium]